MASSLAPSLTAASTAGFTSNSKLHVPILGVPFHHLPLPWRFAIARRASSWHASDRRPLLVVASGSKSSSEEEKASATSIIAENVDQNQRRREMWGRIAWWIVVCYSVPFSLYTLPFIYGDFEIYKHLTVNAALRGNYELAGLHIANHLSTWQIHAAAALLFMAIGPFQFNTAFRNNHPVMHKRLGYTFAVCTIITSVTGATTMREASELGPLAVGIAPFLAAGSLIALAIAIHAARCKQFQRHRRWMLRSAAFGYSVMYTRMLPAFIQVLCKVSSEEALDYGFPLSVALNCGLAELYIQMYFQDRPNAGSILPQAPDENTDTDVGSTKKVL